MLLLSKKCTILYALKFKELFSNAYFSYAILHKENAHVN